MTTAADVRTRPRADALDNALVLIRRNVTTMPRTLDVIVFAAVQPIMFVLLFAYVFGGAIPLPGGGSYREFLLPGVFALALSFASTRTAVSVSTDMNTGLIDRFRSLPMSRSAVLVGRTTADLLLSAFTVLITAACGLLVGWRVHTGPASVASGFLLLLLFSYALSWVGALIGISVATPEAATQAVLTWLFPLAFISNAFVPPQGMPTWMQYVAEWNPISMIVAACRDLWGNPEVPVIHHSWVTDHPAVMSLVWSLAILVVAATAAIARYRAVVAR
jgi:ABC-2 type transport system permease protein